MRQKSQSPVPPTFQAVFLLDGVLSAQFTAWADSGVVRSDTDAESVCLHARDFKVMLHGVGQEGQATYLAVRANDKTNLSGFIAKVQKQYPMVADKIVQVKPCLA